MTPPARDARPLGDQLLHASADRLLVITGNGGERELRKIFLRGSLAEAEREVELGRRLAALPVVHYLAAELDPVTARPCVRMALHAGHDLDQLVGERGALPAPLACAIGSSLADALAQLHTFRASDLPHGLVHGDLKPGNVLWDGQAVRLLDFEHSAAVGSTPAPLGSPGYQSPELTTVAAHPASDVFALGLTLRFLLTGGDAREPALDGHDGDLRELLALCTATAPQLRPTAAAVGVALRELGERLRTDPLQLACTALQQGDLTTADRHFAAAPDIDHERHTELAERLRRATALLQRRPHCVEFAPAAPTDPQALLHELDSVRALLRRFPSHPEALRARAGLRHAAAVAIAGSMEPLAAMRAEECFAQAHAWLEAAQDLVAALQDLPGGFHIADGGDPRLPSPLRQRPLQFLAQQQAALRVQEQEHQALASEVDAAEARLDLAAAEAAIDRLGAQYGGTTSATSQRRDRLHRLGFYLERIARAAPNVERLLELQPEADLLPLMAFLAECLSRSMRSPRANEATGGMGLRSLQIALSNLAEEFPALADKLAPARDVLAQALERASDQAWALVEQAQQKLSLQPVPVRPLQALFHRLDGLRLLETFVDRPLHARSQLLDRIEVLRLELEQARATRDRLARGAEMALAKGHWTTGLFDMERAVQGLAEGGAVEDPDVARLRERLAAARRRKQEIETSVRRNMDLGARYALLQDDPAATFAQRQQVLRERRDCLQFLGLNVPAERAALYARDLREVETQLALEAANEAEAQLDATEDAAERLLLARNTLAQLEESTGSDPGTGAPARVQRLLEHWRKLAATEQKLADQRRAETEKATRQRRMRRLLAVAGLVVVVFGTVTFLPGVMAAGRSPAVIEALQRVTMTAAAADPARAIADVHAVVGVSAASDPVVAQLARASTAKDVVAWHGELVLAIRTSRLLPAELAELWRIGIAVAAARTADAAQLQALLTVVQAAQPEMAQRGVALPANAIDSLRALRR